MYSKAIPQLHHNSVVNQCCIKVIEYALSLLWSYWPQEKTLAVLLCGSWPLGMGCAEVVDGEVKFISDWDLIVIIDDKSELAYAQKIKLTLDSALKEKAKKGEIDAHVDYGFVRFSDLPSEAKSLFWFDCCSHALLIWGGMNPLDQIDRPEKLNPREGVLLLANRALGQLLILSSILSDSDDVNRAVYHCGKVAVDGINALRIVTGKYVPGLSAANDEIGEIEVVSSDRDVLKNIVNTAKFWEEQKRDYNVKNILAAFGGFIDDERPSPFGVWLWAAQMFHTVWNMVVKMMIHDTDVLRTAQEVLIPREDKGLFECMRSWKKFFASSSHHRVKTTYLDTMRFSWRATPISAARVGGVIGLCYHPWGNTLNFQKGIKLIKKFLPSAKVRGLHYIEKWVHFMDDSVSIWRVYVNDYDERTSTLWNHISMIERYRDRGH